MSALCRVAELAHVWVAARVRRAQLFLEVEHFARYLVSKYGADLVRGGPLAGGVASEVRWVEIVFAAAVSRIVVRLLHRREIRGGAGARLLELGDFVRIVGHALHELRRSRRFSFPAHVG